MSTPSVSKLISRSEFRAVLKSVVRCLRGELDAPGLAPLKPEEIHFWFQNITMEDVETVNREIDAEIQEGPEHFSKLQSMLQKIREKVRGEGNLGETNPELPSHESDGQNPKE